MREGEENLIKHRAIKKKEADNSIVMDNTYTVK